MSSCPLLAMLKEHKFVVAVWVCVGVGDSFDQFLDLSTALQPGGHAGLGGSLHRPAWGQVNLHQLRPDAGGLHLLPGRPQGTWKEERKEVMGEIFATRNMEFGLEA